MTYVWVVMTDDVSDVHSADGILRGVFSTESAARTWILEHKHLDFYTITKMELK
jgi:hypothetical protein